MNKCFLLFFMLACPSSFATTLGEQLGLSPFHDWKTIETPRFRITYAAETPDLEAVARKTVGYFEEAHTVLSPIFKWEPRQKTQILLIDPTDQANGLATASLRVGIILYATPPETFYSTTFTDDWLRLLVFHEYVHLLSTDPTTSFWEPLRWLFGDWIRPNTLWPRWLHEGLAVYFETRTSPSGRGRSSYFDAVLRTGVLEKGLNDPKWITLDRIEGPIPFAPGGEAPYLFGYELMNQVARSSKGDAVLGEYSIRSSGRIPFFIGGNLENLTGKDWEQTWDDWVKATRQRMEIQISKLRQQPISRLRWLTREASQILGSALSKDGQWLAYTLSSPQEKEMGLFLRNLKTQSVSRIMSKIQGATLSFTPDSRFLIFSAQRRYKTFNVFSDLGVFDLKTGNVQWLSHGKRFKDPDVSPDGKAIVFTQVKTARTDLGYAELIQNGDGLTLGEIRTLYASALYDRVAQPKFSPDGRRIVFTRHKNESLGEELVQIDLSQKKITSLRNDGKMNRFPTFAPDGALYYVSDATGVDNLYRYAETPEQVTNVLTALWFPTFVSTPGTSKRVYASVYTLKGWNLAEVEVLPVQSEKVRIEKPPAPAFAEATAGKPAPTTAPAKDYSIFPSIWPRAWSPIALYQSDGAQSGAYLGGSVLGFDATHRYEYLGLAAYDSRYKNLDWLGRFSTRVFGPTLALFGSNLNQERLSYGLRRKEVYGSQIYFPFKNTYSSWTPSISFQVERETIFSTGSNSSVLSRSRAVPEISGLIERSDTQASALAVTSEQGSSSAFGVRRYGVRSAPVYKALLSHTQYIETFPHAILEPKMAVAHSSRTSSFRDANVLIKGDLPWLYLNPNVRPNDSFDELYLRGYPITSFLSRTAGVAGLDYKIPLFQIFRGKETLPIYLKQIYGIVFGETAVFLAKPILGQTTAPAVGGGVRLKWTLFNYVPMEVALEYHYGFEKKFGGVPYWFGALGVGGIQF